MWVLAILSRRTDVRENIILGMEAPSQLPGSSVWDWGPLWYEYRIGSYMIRCECKPFHHCDRMCSCLDGCAFLMSRSDVKATTILGMEVPGQLPSSSVWDWGPLWCDCRIRSYKIKSECTHFQTCMLDWFLACVKCKCKAFWKGGLVPRMAKCKCWAIPIIR